jgi:AraC-like DNA-binding protein
MPPRQYEQHEIIPALPDDLLQELLTLPSAQTLPLAVGKTADGFGDTGEYVLVAALQGNCSVTAHAQYALLQPSQVMVLHAVGTYTVQAVSDCVCMTVKLRGSLADRLLGERLRNGAAVLSSGASAVRELVLALLVLEEERPPVGGAVASTYAYTMLVRLHDVPVQDTARKTAFSPLVDSAIAIIQEEFPYLESLDELAERLHVSKAHLIRSFTHKTGVSPGKYITRVRIDYAKLLLQDEDTTIAYVAEASGFANANYFAKVFRRETGMSPSEYVDTTPRRRTARVHREKTPPVW